MLPPSCSLHLHLAVFRVQTRAPFRWTYVSQSLGFLQELVTRQNTAEKWRSCYRRWISFCHSHPTVSTHAMKAAHSADYRPRQMAAFFLQNRLWAKRWRRRRTTEPRGGWEWSTSQCTYIWVSRGWSWRSRRVVSSRRRPCSGQRQWSVSCWPCARHDCSSVLARPPWTRFR